MREITEASREYRRYINGCWLKNIPVDERLPYDSFHKGIEGCLLIFDKSYSSSWDKMEQERRDKKIKGNEDGY